MEDTPVKIAKFLVGLGFGIVLIFGSVVLIKQMRSVSLDSENATLASKLREQLGIYFEDKNEYPASLDAVWNQPGMQDYCTKYNVPDGQKMIFHYAVHSNWCELAFTNFGSVHTEILTNGIVVH